MRPVVLLVGRLPNVIANVAKQLEDLPVEWLGAHNREEVIRQLEMEPKIACVVMGAGLDDPICAFTLRIVFLAPRAWRLLRVGWSKLICCEIGDDIEMSLSARSNHHMLNSTEWHAVRIPACTKIRFVSAGDWRRCSPLPPMRF